MSDRDLLVFHSASKGASMAAGCRSQVSWSLHPIMSGGK
jgi:hypothetical protein